MSSRRFPGFRQRLNPGESGIPFSAAFAYRLAEQFSEMWRMEVTRSVGML